MGNRPKVDKQSFIQDILAGMNREDLRCKYQMTPTAFQNLLDHLLQQGRITNDDLSRIDSTSTFTPAHSQELSRSPETGVQESKESHIRGQASNPQGAAERSQDDRGNYQSEQLMARGNNMGNGQVQLNQALIYAAMSSDLEEVKRLLNQGTDANCRDKNDISLLALAAGVGDIELVKILLANGANINDKDSVGRTALLRAWHGNQIGMIKLLVDKGADVNTTDQDGQTLLIWASREGHAELVKCFLDNGADLSVTAENGWTALMWASVSGHLEIVNLLKHKDGSMVERDIKSENENSEIQGAVPSEKNLALIEAAQVGFLEEIKLLLNEGADVNARDQDGRTALMNACWKGYIKVGKLLLDKGADIDAQDENGRTALIKACMNNHQEIVMFLLNRGANIHAKDKDGRTASTWAYDKQHLAIVNLLRAEIPSVAEPSSKSRTENSSVLQAKKNASLINAAKEGNRKEVERLLNEGADVNTRDTDGYTALNLACWNGHLNIVKLLLKNEADLNAKDKKGHTPLIGACWKGHGDIVIFLLDKGADINVQDEEHGATALMYASRNGHFEIANLLLNRGADISAEDKKGYTALMAARRGGHLNVVKLFLDRGADPVEEGERMASQEKSSDPLWKRKHDRITEAGEKGDAKKRQSSSRGGRVDDKERFVVVIAVIVDLIVSRYMALGFAGDWGWGYYVIWLILWFVLTGITIAFIAKMYDEARADGVSLLKHFVSGRRSEDAIAVIIGVGAMLTLYLIALGLVRVVIWAEDPVARLWNNTTKSVSSLWPSGSSKEEAQKIASAQKPQPKPTPIQQAKPKETKTTQDDRDVCSKMEAYLAKRLAIMRRASGQDMKRRLSDLDIEYDSFLQSLPYWMKHYLSIRAGTVDNVIMGSASELGRSDILDSAGEIMRKGNADFIERCKKWKRGDPEDE